MRGTTNASPIRYLTSQRATRRYFLRLLFLIALPAVATGCHVWPFSILAKPDFHLPECPQYGEWSPLFANRKNPDLIIASGGQLSLSGRITDVPEFHDCQKFIVAGGEHGTFLTLFAIFARDSLREATSRFNSVSDTARTPTDSAAVVSASGFVAVGEVLAIDKGYAQLGIQPLFNCLFLRATYAGLAARMVPVSGNETSCKTITHPEDMPGTNLEVYRRFFKYDTAPPVARWDWDPVNNQQHIGINCGIAWCDIGKSTFHPSSAYALSTGSPNDRVIAVKGWYDEQRLAVPSSATMPFASATSLKPGAIIGTFVPMPDLGKDTGTPGGSRYDTTWVRVATVGMTDTSADYLGKLNLVQSPVKNAIDSVSLCYGKLRTCITNTAITPKCAAAKTPGTMQWWGMITNPTTSPAYFCVTRRGHESIPGLHIPGIVRWRWAIKDETMWIRCLEGCCEVEAGSKDQL